MYYMDELLSELINNPSDYAFTHDLVNVSAMARRGVFVPKTRSMRSEMEKAGYVHLGRMKINGRLDHFWSKSPFLFMDNDTVSAEKVRRYLDRHRCIVDENTL